jgi:hypothetical protein
MPLLAPVIATTLPSILIGLLSVGAKTGVEGVV